MRSRQYVHGDMGQYNTPDWRSLEALLGSDDLCAHFMWMHDVVLDDGTVLNAYKHRWTRCYFHLAEDGRAFYYVTDDVYHEVDPHTAIRAVFAAWECCKPTPEERSALGSALRAAATRAESH
ncbi:MAG TPA: hypothetical protein VK217_03320 [Acidimicrobiales bacterium]|nr:hypothetical protein [Acidimicrobiales bacterium]